MKRALLDVNVLLALLDDARINRSRVLGPRQVTDAYLLAVAVAHGARFVTLDRSVPLAAVRGTRPDDLAVI